MAKCAWCGERFSVSEARSDFDDYFSEEGFYDDQFPEHNICADCAIVETNSNIKAGNEAVGPGGWDC